MELTQKQQIEKATAELFLGLYNSRMGTAFEILHLGDAPDIICADPATRAELKLEISLLENLPGEIRHQLGKGRQPRSKTTGTTVVSLFDDVISQFKATLAKKLLSAYDSRTALVLKQVSILWEPREWAYIAVKFQAEVLSGKENNYGAGIWVICTDNSTWPTSDTLFCLCPPQTWAALSNVDA